MRWIIESLRQHPEIALFFVLALGYGLGSLHIGRFKVGLVLGVLMAGLVVGQLNIPTSESLKNTFFMFFLFAVGYRTGPQFFGSLRPTGLRQLVLTLLVCATAFGFSLFIARLSRFDAGTASGLLAGTMTDSAAFGAAGGAIAQLGAPEAARQALLAKAAVSFAVCYLVGTLLVVWLVTKLGPRLMRVDLANACSELEREMGLPQDKTEASLANPPFVTRAYTVPLRLDSKPVLELEASFHGYRVFVERLRREGEITEPDDGDRLCGGDQVTLWGRREALIGPGNPLFDHEVYDGELLNIEIVSRDVVVTRRMRGRTLGLIAASHMSRGIFLQKLVRLGRELPYTLQTPIESGDVLSVTGEKSHVDELVEELGYAKQPTDATPMIMVSSVIFLGGLVGLPALSLSGIKISMTLFVGVLLGGLALGWLSSRCPRFGGVPEPALWLFDSLGLAGFLAVTGLQAGPGFVRGLQEAGLPLIVATALVVTVANVVGILVGHRLLHMHPGVVLGACAGASTSPSALGALLETARSRVPALSYGISYALGQFILALAGSLIVTMSGR